MGFDRNTGEPIRYAWSALTMPACNDCNGRYSALEGAAKPVIESLLQRKPITAKEASILLDWLDKIRICLWLHQLVIQKNIDMIDPKLVVDNRLGTRDRLLSMYSLSGLDPGLNAIGIETLIFQHQPSCFTLRVNDIALFNASSDFAYLARCGLPYPAKLFRIVDGPQKGTIATSSWRTDLDAKPVHPIVEFPLPEPDFQIIQPIYQPPSGDLIQCEILQQQRNEVCVFTEAGLSPSRCTDAQSRLRDIAAATFRYQAEMHRIGSFVGENPKAVEYAEGMSRILSDLNEFRAIQVERGLIRQGEPDQATLLFRDAMAASLVSRDKLQDNREGT